MPIQNRIPVTKPIKDEGRGITWTPIKLSKNFKAGGKRKKYANAMPPTKKIITRGMLTKPNIRALECYPGAAKSQSSKAM